MRKLNQTIAIALQWVLTALVLIMTVVILVQIFWRYVLEAPLVWSSELALILMGWITFLGSALLLQSKDHLAIDILVARMPPPLARAAALLGGGLVLIFCVCLVYGAWIMMEQTRDSITPGLQISVAWQYGGAFVGGVLLILSALEQISEALRIGRRAPGGDDA